LLKQTAIFKKNAPAQTAQEISRNLARSNNGNIPHRCAHKGMMEMTRVPATAKNHNQSKRMTMTMTMMIMFLGSEATRQRGTMMVWTTTTTLIIPAKNGGDDTMALTILARKGKRCLKRQ